VAREAVETAEAVRMAGATVGVVTEVAVTEAVVLVVVGAATREALRAEAAWVVETAE